jgi:hypothetical protein
MDVVALQPEGIVDHVCVCNEHEYYLHVEDQGKMAKRCSMPEVQAVLARCAEFTTKAGGSAANTAKGLSFGFGHKVAVVSQIYSWRDVARSLALGAVNRM